MRVQDVLLEKGALLVKIAAKMIYRKLKHNSQVHKEGSLYYIITMLISVPRASSSMVFLAFALSMFILHRCLLFPQ